MTAGSAASRRVLARTPVAPLPASSPKRPTGITGRMSAPPETSSPGVCSFRLPQMCGFRLPLTCHRAARRRYGICSAVLICGLVATEAAAQPTWCGGHSIEWAGGPPRAFSALADGSSSALAIEQPAWLVRDRWDALVFNAFENPSPEGRLTEVLARGDVSSIRVCMQSPETSEVGQRRCCMKPLAGEVIWPALLLTLCSQWLQPPDGAR